MATLKSLNNSWQQLYAKGNNMRVPEREILTKDSVYHRKRPEPEVVEHMLDDLESKMRNYFILYNREREFRKKSEENCYRLEQELLNYRQKLEEANNKFQCLERKVKSMVDQPLKLKETIYRIDLLYNQMDTLIQAFVGVGSCAVIQGYSRVAFIKLCLEYLYPCRELDVRLNTLYNALYSVLTQYDGLEVTKNEVLKPMTFHDNNEKANLTGLSLKVHRLMLKCDLPNDDTKNFGCYFRYDHEPKEVKDTDKSRYLSVEVKPMDNASKVYEFNLLAQNNQLPPKVPNVVPKLVVDVYADDYYVGSAEANLISEKTLKPCEPWNVLDTNGVNCGDVVVTVLPMPENAKLPAVNFANKTDELMKVNKGQEHQTPFEQMRQPNKTQVEQTNQNVQNNNQVVEKQNKNQNEPTNKKEPGKAFEPKGNPNFRKPLFNPKTNQATKAAGTTQVKDKQQPQQNKGGSNVSRLSMMFKGKKHNEENNNQEVEQQQAPVEQMKEEQPTQNTEQHQTVNENVNLVKMKTNNLDVVNKDEQDDKSSIKDLIVRKLSSGYGSKQFSNENNQQVGDQNKNQNEPTNKKEDQDQQPVNENVNLLKKKTTNLGVVNEPKEVKNQNEQTNQNVQNNNQVVEQTKKQQDTDVKPVEQNVQHQGSKKLEQEVETDTKNQNNNQNDLKLESLPSKKLLPPMHPAKQVPTPPVNNTVRQKAEEPQVNLPEKPLVPIVIAPKLLKKPLAPKK